jgi:ethanolamine ammonia-lyase large subunit
MLNYQSTSYHDALAMRRLFGLEPAPEFAVWLERHGLPPGRSLLDSGPAGQTLLKHLEAVLETTGSDSG